MATAKKPSTTKDLPKNFFQTTPLKLAILSLCTFGFYEVYWFFEMLRRVDPESNKYGRAAKSLFGWIFLYELLTKLKVQRAASLAFLYFITCLAVRTPGAFWTISLLSFIPLAYIQAQLNKRLPRSVKAPYSRTALVVVVVGGMIVLFSVIGFWTQNNSQPQDNKSVGYQNTSHKTKVSQDQPAKNTTTEQQPTDTSATDASATPSTSSSTKAAAKTTTPSATSTSKSTVTTPTAYPTADPAKIKQYAAGFNGNSYPNNPQVTSIVVSRDQQPCSPAGGLTGYHYDAYFMSNAKASTLAGQWELVSGNWGASPLPTFGPHNVPAGIVRMYDDVYSVFNFLYSDFTVRLHITSPNDIYSNSITIPGCHY